MTRPPEPQAAPPDDGHQGSFTRPADTLVEPSWTKTQPPADPGVDQMTRGQGALLAWLLIPLAIAALIVIAYWVAPS